MVKKAQNQNDISTAEWEVMRIIWTLGKAHTSQIIRQLQAKKNWSESTIKTLVRRLVRKGYLRIDKEGRKFIYCPTISENEMMVSQTEKMMAHMCDMHKGRMLIDILKKVPLSQADIEVMQRELKQKIKTAPKTVKCNCLASGVKDC